ncbi:hypothetical protein CP_0582 [Chlamydia pneumoniae AR39]|uniref:Uncharacterized protein n=1 Tax=Chlamydia pneumoniae TaxID=83558 RepID=Q9K241_CHLPN|nr:hypothetical protein CP_0582 [Chlamydia pneumoniae AR39]
MILTSYTFIKHQISEIKMIKYILDPQQERYKFLDF